MSALNSYENKPSKGWLIYGLAILAVTTLLVVTAVVVKKAGTAPAVDRDRDQTLPASTEPSAAASLPAAGPSAQPADGKVAATSSEYRTPPSQSLTPTAVAAAPDHAKSAADASPLPAAELTTAAVPVPRIPVASDSRFHLPLAFQPVNPKALTPAGKLKLEQLQQEFVDAIGQEQTPSDPAFQSRWISAQIRADMLYRACFGQSAFQEIQSQRAQSEIAAVQ